MAATGIGLQTIALAAWSGFVLYSGLTGESIVTANGSEKSLAVLGFVITIILAVITLTVARGYRWSTGPGLTLEILFIGGVVMSGDFLTVLQQLGLLVAGLIIAGLLLYVRVRQAPGPDAGLDDPRK